MRWKVYLVVLLIIVTGVFYYNLTERESYETQIVKVVRVIDGDTFETENQVMVRLKGINTPEKNELGYEEAKEFLKNLIENKTIKIQISEVDIYNRLLVYAFIGGDFINKQILEKGFAHLYYYDEDNYFNELQIAEKQAIFLQKGIWKKSSDSECVELIELNHDEPEKLILENKCTKVLNITIKDEATHIYHVSLNPGMFEQNFSHIWNTEGDTLFIWNSDGLILMERY